MRTKLSYRGNVREFDFCYFIPSEMYVHLTNSWMLDFVSEMENASTDRLSGLPDSVKFHILWFLPVEDVVRTTILSKRWNKFWTTTPFLNFDVDASPCYMNEFRHFVNQFLFRWNGVRILKFRLCCFFCDSDYMIGRDIKSWANFATYRGVEEFYLRISVLSRIRWMRKSKNGPCYPIWDWLHR